MCLNFGERAISKTGRFVPFLGRFKTFVNNRQAEVREKPILKH
jgi:hypothetical protein